MNVTDKQLDNWSRTKQELEDLMSILKFYLDYDNEADRTRVVSKCLLLLGVSNQEIRNMTLEEGLTYVYLFT